MAWAREEQGLFVSLALMTGLAGLQLFFRLIFGSYFFVATKTVGVGRTFKGIKFFFSGHFAAQDIGVVAGLTFTDFLSFGIGYLLAIRHTMMAICAGEKGLMCLMREKRWFWLCGTSGFQGHFFGPHVAGTAQAGNSTDKKSGSCDGDKNLLDHNHVPFFVC